MQIPNSHHLVLPLAHRSTPQRHQLRPFSASENGCPAVFSYQTQWQHGMHIPGQLAVPVLAHAAPVPTPQYTVGAYLSSGRYDFGQPPVPQFFCANSFMSKPYCLESTAAKSSVEQKIEAFLREAQPDADPYGRTFDKAPLVRYAMDMGLVGDDVTAEEIYRRWVDEKVNREMFGDSPVGVATSSEPSKHDSRGTCLSHPPSISRCQSQAPASTRSVPSLSVDPHGANEPVWPHPGGAVAAVANALSFRSFESPQLLQLPWNKAGTETSSQPMANAGDSYAGRRRRTLCG